MDKFWKCYLCLSPSLEENEEFPTYKEQFKFDLDEDSPFIMLKLATFESK